MLALFASAESFTWLSLLPFLQGEGAKYLPLAHSVLVVVLLLALAWAARVAVLRLPPGRDGLIPEANLRPRNFFELYVEGMLNFCRGILGHDADRYFPLIAGIFIYIFFNNLLGVIPGFLPPTDSLNTNLPMALVIFAVYNVAGVMRHGIVNYLKHFLAGLGFWGIGIALIELVSHIVRPVSLSVRLYGNIFGDHQVLNIFMNELPRAISAVLGYGIPVIFLGLGIFVSFIQAFVFSLLSSMYIALAVVHEEHSHKAPAH